MRWVPVAVPLLLLAGTVAADTMVEVDTEMIGHEPARWHPSSRPPRRLYMGRVSDSDDAVLSCGRYVCCAIDRNQPQERAENGGSLRCWGYMVLHGMRSVPKGAFVQVSVGGAQGCALRADGSAVCWGALSMEHRGPFTQLSCGERHACALRRDGGVECWGAAPEGASNAPRGTFLQVSAGGSHSCAIRADNTAFCWGANGKAQSEAPARFQFLQLSASPEDHTCAVDVHRRVKCWGHNRAGQCLPPVLTVPGGQAAAIGAVGEEQGGAADAESSADTGFGLAVEQVTAGSAFSCALLEDGAAVCWGSETGSSGARRPPGGRHFATISAGHTAVCGVLLGEGDDDEGGRVLCWGEGAGGILDPPADLRVSTVG